MRSGAKNLRGVFINIIKIKCFWYIRCRGVHLERDTAIINYKYSDENIYSRLYSEKCLDEIVVVKRVNIKRRKKVI